MCFVLGNGVEGIHPCTFFSGILRLVIQAHKLNKPPAFFLDFIE